MPNWINQYSSFGEKQMRGGRVRKWSIGTNCLLGVACRRHFYFSTSQSLGSLLISAAFVVDSFVWAQPSCWYNCFWSKLHLQLSALETPLKLQEAAQPSSKMGTATPQGGATGSESGCFFGKLPVTVSLSLFSWAADTPKSLSSTFLPFGSWSGEKVKFSILSISL